MIPCDFACGSLHPLSVWRDVCRLRDIIRRLQPDIVHFIALKPVLTAVLGRMPVRAAVFHITGLGTLAKGRLKKTNEDRPTARLTLIGDPLLCAGQKVALGGWIVWRWTGTRISAVLQ